MGLHQVLMNSGQAVGPIIGAALMKSSWLSDPIFGASLSLPMMYLSICELCVLGLNIFVYYRGDDKKRALFDISLVPKPDLPDATQDRVESTTDGEGSATDVDKQTPVESKGAGDAETAALQDIKIGTENKDDLQMLRAQKAAKATEAASAAVDENP